MKVVGVTGGIGAGKSTVLDYLASRYGAVILRADDIGHEVMEPGRECYQPVLDLLGQGVLGEEGRIDRKKAAELLFASPKLLERMNSIIHPAVRQVIESAKRRQQEKEDGADKTARDGGESLLVIEAALLAEGGLEALCDEVWTVEADPVLRIQRLMRQRGYTAEKCKAVMASQGQDDHYRKLADRVIDNSGSGEETRRQVDRAMAANFSWEVSTSKYQDMYDWLIG